jgi:hypothetical protein
MNVSLSRSMIVHGLGSHPASEKGTCSFTNRWSIFNNIIPCLVYPMLPNAPEGHTKDLFMLLIKML